MYSQSLLKSKKLNSCLKIVFYNVILISKKKKKRQYGDDVNEKIINNGNPYNDSS